MSADAGNGWRERAHLFLRVTHISHSSVSCPVWAGNQKFLNEINTNPWELEEDSGPQWVWSILGLLFASVCIFYTYCNTPAVKGLSLILCVSVGGLLRFHTFTVSVWGFFFSGGLDMISKTSVSRWNISAVHNSGPHVCENESEKTLKFAIVNIVTIKTPPAPLSLIFKY